MKRTYFNIIALVSIFVSMQAVAMSSAASKSFLKEAKEKAACLKSIDELVEYWKAVDKAVNDDIDYMIEHSRQSGASVAEIQEDQRKKDGPERNRRECVLRDCIAYHSKK